MTRDEAQQLEREAGQLYERGASGQDFDALFSRGWRPPSLRSSFYPAGVKPVGYPTYGESGRTPRGRPKRTPEQELERAQKRRARERDRRVQAKTGLRRTL
jgi:hypothetical protein